jgi:hypothetical protein
MTITVTRSKTTLTAGDYTAVPTLTDPRDGSAVDALTNFDFNLPDLPPQTIDGRLALAHPLTMTLRPNCRRRSSVTMTPGLLAHEQFHWDCAFVVARRFAREAGALRAATQADLAARFQALFRLHMRTRNDLIQGRYDIDSRHGTNAHYQGIWKRRMTACLGDANATQIGGFYL